MPFQWAGRDSIITDKHLAPHLRKRGAGGTSVTINMGAQIDAPNDERRTVVADYVASGTQTISLERYEARAFGLSVADDMTASTLVVSATPFVASAGEFAPLTIEASVTFESVETVDVCGVSIVRRSANGQTGEIDGEALRTADGVGIRAAVDASDGDTFAVYVRASNHSPFAASATLTGARVTMYA